jgi:colanic acid/amylovoran biosynthesis protein
VRVLITNAYVRANAGDAALLSVLVRHVREAYPGCEVRVAMFEDPAVHPDFEGVPNVGSVRRYLGEESISRPRRIGRKVRLGLAASAALIAPRLTARFALAGELRAAADADLVVSIGGGFLNGRADLGGDLNVLSHLLPLAVAQRHGVPVVFAPQSYGPFGTGRQSAAIRRVLRAARLVLVREDESVAILSGTGVAGPTVTRAVDSGFAFRGEDRDAASWRRELGIEPGRTLVGLTVRQWLDPRSQAAFEAAVAAFVDRVQGGGTARVVLIPQVTSDYQADDDRIVSRRIARACDPARPPVSVEEPGDHARLKSLYSSLDLLVGTRFHSVIFGLTSLVPAIAIEYEHKTGGIMRDLGLGEWVLKMPDVTADNLTDRFADLVAGQDRYRAMLRAVMPSYIERSERTPTLLRAAVPGGAPATVS